ncbi:MAG: hypothetical protein LBH42_05135 [Treponema sp.]|nr:hypothetical protein [Treponema sp.]
MDSRLFKEKLLFILVNRTVILFFIICLLTLFLYAIGTIQDFIDSTQLFLLKLYETFGIFLFVTSLFGMVLDLGRLIKMKKIRYLLRSGGYLLLVIFSVVTVLAVMTIITLSGGSGAG